jgi:membrane protein DedA with SNARE-associated domain
MQYVVSLMNHHGLLIVLGSVLLNEGGILFPSYPILMIAGALTLADGPPLLAVMATAAMGAMLTNIGWYLAGVRFGAGILKLLCQLSVTPDSCVRQTENIYTRVGLMGAATCKVHPGT